MKRPLQSLQARALVWLAQREQSRTELRRKLLRAAQAMQSDAEARGDFSAQTAAEDPTPQVDQLLDALQAKGLLCEKRFMESRVRVRAPGLGLRRIEAELASHGLTLAPAPLQRLRDSELQRAQQLWQRRFGRQALDAKDRARQMRFLAGRGFSGEVVHRVVARVSDLAPDDDC